MKWLYSLAFLACLLSSPCSLIMMKRTENEGTIDGDDFVEDMQEKLEEKALFSLGLSSSQIALYKQQKVYREQVSLYRYLERSKLLSQPPDDEASSEYVTYEEIAVRLATAYESLGRRPLALAALERGLEALPGNIAIILTLARLYFRDNQKESAEKLLVSLIDRFKAQETESKRSRKEDENERNQGSSEFISQEDAADAYYILGWIAIHGDNHTKAYRIWEEGFTFICSDERLSRQHQKVACWRDIHPSTDAVFLAFNSELLGRGRHMDGVFDRERDFDAFSIPEGVPESALGLFDSTSQRRQLIFRSKHPLLATEECARVIALAEAEMAGKNQGKWGSVRSASLPTTDIAVEDIPLLRPWLRSLLCSVLQPMLATCFPLLADGSSLGSRGKRLRVHDAFIVRYDSADESLSLPEHSDTSALSFTLALNSQASPNEEEHIALPIQGNVSRKIFLLRCGNEIYIISGDITYSGGGTWFRALQKSKEAEGGVVDAEAGALYASTSGIYTNVTVVHRTCGGFCWAPAPWRTPHYWRHAIYTRALHVRRELCLSLSPPQPLRPTRGKRNKGK